MAANLVAVSLPAHKVVQKVGVTKNHFQMSYFVQFQPIFFNFDYFLNSFFP